MSMQPIVFADVLARLKNCPECGEEMVAPNPDWLDEESRLMKRECPEGHGFFTLTEVTPWGDVGFQYFMRNWRS